MMKTDLRALARVGAVQSLKEIESKITELHRAFPDLFVGDMRPQLLKPEMRNGHGPAWPEFSSAIITRRRRRRPMQRNTNAVSAEISAAQKAEAQRRNGLARPAKRIGRRSGVGNRRRGFRRSTNNGGG